MTTATLDVSLEQLEAAALRLDSESRARLAYRLLDSVDAAANGNSPTNTDWIDEAEHRLQAFLDDKGQAVDGEQVLREAAQRLLDLRAGRATEHDGAEVMRAAFEQFP